MYTLLRPNVLHRFMSLRYMSMAEPKSLVAKRGVCDPTAPAFLTFEDPRAFKVKSFWEIIRALGVFRLCSFPVLVNNCGKLMISTKMVLGERAFSMVMRPSVYAQFVAGETEREIAESMQKMSSLGLRPMLAVPIEEDLGESTGERRYEDNLVAMLECIHMSHNKGWSKNPMMQLKITALLSPELCVKLTSLLRSERYDLNLLVKAMEGEASANKVRVLVDAEYTYINPALSLVTMAMMKKFNQQSAWIWNTYQCYLKESRNLLYDAIQTSVDQVFCLGIKLVRGAYMDKERNLAEKEKRTDPIHESWENTNERMVDLGIDKHSSSVCFGQLLGMCDHVSLTLAQHGFSVYKSVPYGTVDNTLPYLVRRAQENRAVLQGIRKERDLLRQELNRRIREKITGAKTDPKK
ncbi:Hydroxyproline dehydrogenase [Triplophysa tibetana]|uniref:Proline dehydrogenase n=1 Tax=Triplophysa tibetana TaxID=1572043 RepID=A0A5A9PYN9_9TELE|nr:Hydroxyproline dehydrogenase [Triplophysa tibetana]